jgi:GT2 family glycosyltransferase|tara:strand:+ start:5118 stop:6128 length:1011 start_codon:yes stop_codon:yes gene_type:complete
MKKNLAIVVLTWNDYKNTIICLKSIINQLKHDQKLFLIDNNSKNSIFEKTCDWLDKNYKKKFNKLIIGSNYKINDTIFKNKSIFLLRNKKNLGCGLGHNPGYKLAITNNFKFVARIDNDMLVPKNFFNKILINFYNQTVQGVSPKILYKHNRKLIWWMGTKIGNSLKFQTHMRDYPYGLKDNKKYSNIIKTDAIAGCASVMRCSRLKKVGLSDKDFFYGPEDVEFSRRLFTVNGSLVVDRDLKIFHSVTQSFKGLNKRKIYFEYKYRLVLIKKIGKPFDKFFGYSISLIKFILYVLLFFKKRHRIKIQPVFLALIHFYQNKLGDFDRKNKIFLNKN